MSSIKSQSQLQGTHKNQQKLDNTIQDIVTYKKQNLGLQNLNSEKVQGQMQKTINIFTQANQQNKSFNIFNQKQESQQKKNIFASEHKSVNLFNISTAPQSTNNNIFKSNSKPLVKTLEDDQQRSSSNASSSLVVKAQSEFNTRPEKLEMKFDYESPWKMVKSFNLKKFKNGVNPSKQHIYLTFETHSQYLDRIFVLIRARETKVLMFQGIGLNNITDKVVNFMNKEENVKVTVLKQQKSQKEQIQVPQLIKEQIKLQFENIQDANNFKKYVEDTFSKKSLDEK